MYTFLYVEDNLDNVRLMESIIDQMENSQLRSVCSAEQGIDFARREFPDIILMDINLPGMSGIEALKQLQDKAETSHIPVIAITAAALPSEVEAGLRAGFKGYITKPIDLKELIRTIEEILAGVKDSG
jgi:CheY-like chemotaxis protein